MGYRVLLDFRSPLGLTVCKKHSLPAKVLIEVSKIIRYLRYAHLRSTTLRCAGLRLGALSQSHV